MVFFHGKFTSFMSGFRGVGKYVSKTSPPNKMSPKITQINFTVPSRTTLLDQINAPHFPAPRGPNMFDINLP